jgi:diadenosine tetraphosphate (Ap4A) HIT family hydrolase
MFTMHSTEATTPMERHTVMNCAYCEWVRDPRGRGSENRSVYEDDVALVLVAPSHRAQAWVIPKAHYNNLSNLDERTGQHLFKLGMRAALSLGGTPGDDLLVLLEGDAAAKDPHVHVRVCRKRGRGAP